MAVKLETMIDLLKKDLGLEYIAIVQYAQHSGVLTGAEYGDNNKEIKIHATEVLQHAITLSEQIGYLGGVLHGRCTGSQNISGQPGNAGAGPGGRVGRYSQVQTACHLGRGEAGDGPGPKYPGDTLCGTRALHGPQKGSGPLGEKGGDFPFHPAYSIKSVPALSFQFFVR